MINKDQSSPKKSICQELCNVLSICFSPIWKKPAQSDTDKAGEQIWNKLAQDDIDEDTEQTTFLAPTSQLSKEVLEDYNKKVSASRALHDFFLRGTPIPHSDKATIASNFPQFDLHTYGGDVTKDVTKQFTLEQREVLKKEAYIKLIIDQKASRANL